MTTRHRTAAELIAGSGLPVAEARALLAHALGTSREALVAAPDRSVAPAAVTRFDALAARRRDDEPLAYLVGYKEFYGRLFWVTPDVLVPRPETELLVDAALRELRGRRRRRVLDLGTGSGCIAITLALEAPDAGVTAVDASEAALAVAGANAQRLDARVDLVASDWFAALRASFDLIVANPPYVAAADAHLAALRHEPATALVSGTDGLDALREIAGAAPAFLAKGGSLLVEHGYDQGSAVRGLFAEAGFEQIATHRDLAGHERVCSGRRE